MLKQVVDAKGTATESEQRCFSSSGFFHSFGEKQSAEGLD